MTKLRTAANAQTLADLIALWADDDTRATTNFATEIGITRKHAQTMKDRGSLPPEHWPATIEAAKRRRIKGVTTELLFRLYTSERPRRRQPHRASAAA